jgi:arginine exporter protein ArgO
MEPSEKFAFTVIVLLGVFYIAFPYINWDYKTLILQINGLLFLTWTAWVVFTDVSNRYKLVKVDN